MRSSADPQTNKIFTIPNLLSLVRIALIPLIVWAYCARQDNLLTAILLALSGISDVMDGIIARKYGLISDLGKALDPIADKLTQAAVLLCLIGRYPLMLLPFILLLVKETVTGLTSLEVIRRSGKVYGALWHGKVTTFLLYAVMLLHILWGDIPAQTSTVLIWVCSGMMLFSFLLYVMRNLYLLRAHRKGRKS